VREFGIFGGVGWEAYDPSRLVRLAREQLAEEPAIAEALAKCSRSRRESKAYVHFVDPSRPNEPGSDWQFDRNVFLTDPERGDLVLDVLKDGRIGGVEFLNRL